MKAQISPEFLGAVNEFERVSGRTCFAFRELLEASQPPTLEAVRDSLELFKHIELGQADDVCFIVDEALRQLDKANPEEA